MKPPCSTSYSAAAIKQTERDFFNFSHRYAKYLIVGLSLYKSNCMIAWETKLQS